MKIFRGLILLLTLFIGGGLCAQPYILNGSATQNTCNCYTLTPAINTQSGSVWNENKIDLNAPFNFIFNVFLGCKDAAGADGIVFILQPISTSVGSTGGGMGFEGIRPSVGVVLDTWQNTENNDPAFDHISINANGVLTHGTDLAGPVQITPSNPDAEDCQWHTLRIIWDPTTLTLSTYFDGFFRLSSTVDMVSTIFNNDPMVYWGFSAGTGGSNNLQQFCTALNPNFNANNVANVSCFGTPVTFTNTSQSFATVTNVFWDFGDGTTSTLASPPPHNYAAPGIYKVKLAITALDGCKSDTMIKDIVVGDYPLADFNIFDTCSGAPPRIDDLSTVGIGNVSKWNWVLDGTPVAVSQQPQLTGMATGPHQLELVATSNYGCSSTVVSKTFNMIARSVITAEALDGCVNIPVAFTAQQMDNATMVTGWNWQVDNTIFSNQQNAQHTFTTTGIHNVQVTAMASNGCESQPITIPLFINQAIANAGNDTIIVENIPFRLNGSGGVQYSWSPATGLDNPALAAPLVTLTDDINYLLTVTTQEGCKDDDEVKITVFKGSAIYVPTGFTPNKDGLNDQLRPYYVGIKSVELFQVYNRWGQLVFSTKDLGAGWDGSWKGQDQPTGSYVWIVKATDYVGKVYNMKGTSSIIR